MSMFKHFTTFPLHKMFMKTRFMLHFEFDANSKEYNIAYRKKSKFKHEKDNFFFEISYISFKKSE